MRLRPLATVRARTVLGGSLALGIALVLSVSTAGQLLRRSLIRSIDEVAEVRAAEVAGLPRGADLPQGLSSEQGEILQVVGADGRVLATSIPEAATDRISQLLPSPGRFRSQTVGRLDGGIGTEGRYRLLALREQGGPDAPVVYVATGLDSVEHHVAVLSRLVLAGLPLLLGWWPTRPGWPSDGRCDRWRPSAPNWPTSRPATSTGGYRSPARATRSTGWPRR